MRFWSIIFIFSFCAACGTAQKSLDKPNLISPASITPAAGSESYSGKILTVTNSSNQKIEFLEKDLRTKSILIFISTHCLCSPEQLLSIHEIEMILKNHPEYSSLIVFEDRGQNLRHIKKYYSLLKTQIPFIIDHDFKISDLFNVQVTPFAIFLDSDELYRGGILGRIESKSELPYLKQAIEQHLAGKSVTHATSKSIGCVIRKN